MQYTSLCSLYLTSFPGLSPRLLSLAFHTVSDKSLGTRLAFTLWPLFLFLQAIHIASVQYTSLCSLYLTSFPGLSPRLLSLAFHTVSDKSLGTRLAFTLWPLFLFLQAINGKLQLTIIIQYGYGYIAWFSNGVQRIFHSDANAEGLISFQNIVSNDYAGYHETDASRVTCRCPRSDCRYYLIKLVIVTNHYRKKTVVIVVWLN